MNIELILSVCTKWTIILEDFQGFPRLSHAIDKLTRFSKKVRSTVSEFIAAESLISQSLSTAFGRALIPLLTTVTRFNGICFNNRLPTHIACSRFRPPIPKPCTLRARARIRPVSCKPFLPALTRATRDTRSTSLHSVFGVLEVLGR
jgi:hypothetical protein